MKNFLKKIGSALLAVTKFLGRMLIWPLKFISRKAMTFLAMIGVLLAILVGVAYYSFPEYTVLAGKMIASRFQMSSLNLPDFKFWKTEVATKQKVTAEVSSPQKSASETSDDRTTLVSIRVRRQGEFEFTNQRINVKAGDVVIIDGQSSSIYGRLSPSNLISKGIKDKLFQVVSIPIEEMLAFKVPGSSENMQLGQGLPTALLINQDGKIDFFIDYPTAFKDFAVPEKNPVTIKVTVASSFPHDYAEPMQFARLEGPLGSVIPDFKIYNEIEDVDLNKEIERFVAEKAVGSAKTEKEIEDRKARAKADEEETITALAAKGIKTLEKGDSQ